MTQNQMVPKDWNEIGSNSNKNKEWKYISLVEKSTSQEVNKLELLVSNWNWLTLIYSSDTVPVKNVLQN